MATMSDTECVDENVASDDGIADSGIDSKADGKKRKFKPLQAVRKLFNRSSRRRSKSKDRAIDPVSYKSKSTTALSEVHSEEEDNKPGFRKKSSLSGSRSISEDSIFAAEQKEANLDALKKMAVSDETLNQRALKDELFGKLKGRQPCSSDDEDEGLASSPTTKLTTADIIMAGSMKPLKDKNMNQEHESSLLSVDGSDAEADTFESSWNSKVAGVTSRQSPIKDSKMDLDFEAIKTVEAPLGTEAAKHKMSVRPKGRKMSKKMHIEKAATAPLPRLSEESQTKASPEIKSAIVSDVNPIETEIQKERDKTETSRVVIRTPDETDNDNIPHSDPVEIPGKRPTMRHGLSSSPLNQSILDEMKVKRRQTSTKTIEDLENRKSVISPESQEGSEFSQMLTKMKRKSVHRKDDEKTVDVAENSKEDKTNYSHTDEITGKDLSVPVEKADSSAKQVVVTTAATTKASTDSTFCKKDKNISIQEPYKEISKIVKNDEHSKSGQKVETKVVLSESQKGTSVESASLNDAAVTSLKVSGYKKAENASESQSASKLSSPKEEYKQKRQGRSKTLPEHPVILEGNTNVSSDSSKVQRSHSQGCDLEASIVLKSKTDDVPVSSVDSKPEPKKLNARSSMFDENHAGGQPAWIKMAKKKQSDEDSEKSSSSEKKEDISIKRKTSPTEVKSLPVKTSEVKESSPTKAVSSLSKTFGHGDKPTSATSNVPSLSKSFKQDSISSSVSSHKPVKQDSSVQSINKTVKKDVTPPPQVANLNKFSSGSETSSALSTKKPVTISTISKSHEKKLDGGDNKVASKPSMGMKFDSSNRSSVKKTVDSDTKPIGLKFDSSTRTSFTSKSKEAEKSETSKDLNSVKKPGLSESKKMENSSTPAWRRDITKKKSQTGGDVKIEIIDKPNAEKAKPKDKTPEVPVQKVQLRDKTNVDSSKCSETQSNRSSTVLDMVKNFQKRQVTT